MKVESLAEKLLFTTTKIECSDNQGNESIGTGFFVSYEKDGTNSQFVVTNKHVVKDSEKGKISFLKRKDENPQLGNSVDFHFSTNFHQFWFGHKDENIDIAIMSLSWILPTIMSQKHEIYFNTIPNTIIPSDDNLKEIDSLEEVIFIGYPYGFWDEKNFLPIVRKGITASPINIDFDGEKKFIIDASVFPGSSGSPVFLFNKGMYPRKEGGNKVGTRLLLLGVVSQNIGKNSFHDLESVPQNVQDRLGITTNQPINLGVVYKSELITETIEQYIESQKEPKSEDS